MTLPQAASVVQWFTSPSVVPWVGAVIAAVAVVCLEPRATAREPARAAGRGLRAGLVWLVLIWLLGLVFPGSGTGQGEAGVRSGGGSGPANTPGPARATAEIKDGPLPTGTPDDVILLVRFVPSGGNPAVAREFACDLYRRDATGGGKRIEIRATDMQGFERLLNQHLRDVVLPSGRERAEVRINRTPFPGEAAIRRVAERVRGILPATTVVIEERAEP